ncbi:hypothetical protein QEF67_003202 [Klebsiella aerogenes]|uniref:hypothetical protein n=1 Tax=Klebsiella aerogenes TaxID=548 RepID=UPI002A291961|nr:hypothetical protein [Klebsiella aerogenes]
MAVTRAWSDIMDDPKFQNLNDVDKIDVANAYRSNGGFIPEQYGSQGIRRPWNEIKNDPSYQKLGLGEQVDVQKQYINKGGYVPTSDQVINAGKAIGSIVAPAYMKADNWLHSDWSGKPIAEDGSLPYSEKEIQSAELQDPTARALGNAAVGLAAFATGSELAALPELGGISGFAAENLAGSAASQVATKGDITAKDTAIDMATAGLIEGGMHGYRSVFSPSDDIAASTALASRSGERALQEVMEAKKNSYSATANSQTFESAFKSMREEQPSIHPDEVLATWAERDPAMRRVAEDEEMSQIERLDDVLFPEGAPDNLTLEALHKTVNASKLTTERDLLDTALNNPAANEAVAAKAIERMSKHGLIPPNMTKLSEDIRNDLGLDVSKTDKMLSWLDSFNVLSSELRKRAAERATREILDETIEMVTPYHQKLLAESKNIDLARPVGGDSLDHVIHGSKRTALAMQAINSGKMLKKLKALKGSSKVNPDTFGSLVAEAQELIYGNGSRVMTKTRENLEVLNFINEMKRSSGAPLELKMLLAKVGLLPVTMPASFAKAFKDVSQAKSVRQGRELYTEYKQSKEETRDVIRELNDRHSRNLPTDEQYAELARLNGYSDLETFVRGQIAKKAATEKARQEALSKTAIGLLTTP